ncbi:MAG: WG repeat-containing protein [Saprospiraceae bacterium]
MFIKTLIFSILSICQLTAIGQDTITFFPWINDGQLCQVNAAGIIKSDTILTTLDYPTYNTTDELTAYEAQGYYGFKDANDNIVIKAGYEKVGHFREGFTWVKIDYKRYYYINKVEEPLVNFTFDRCYDFQNGLARVYDKNTNINHNGFGYINTKGETVIALQYKKAFDFVNGFALVQDNDQNWWLINQKGEKIQGPCVGLKVNKTVFNVE